MRKPLSTSTKISIVSAVIGVAALGLSIWQGYETRLHNRVMTRPVLVFGTPLAPSEPFRGIMIGNFGTGHAKVTNFEVYVDGERVPGRGAQIWPEALRRLSGGATPGHDFFWTYWQPDSWIPADGKSQRVFGLLWTPGSGPGPQDTIAAWLGNGRLNVVFDYASAYGETFHVEYRPRR